MTAAHLVRKAPHLAKNDAKTLFASGLLRAVAKHGKGTIADAMDCTPRTVEKALALDTLPELEKAFNALRVEPSVLDEVAAHFGMQISPIDTADATDMDVVALLGLTVARMAEAKSPSSPGGAARVHSETLAIADIARPLVQLLMGIIAEADQIRGIAAVRGL